MLKTKKKQKNNKKIASKGYTILHELPKRIRLQCKALYSPDLDISYLEAILAGLSGIESVRINTLNANIIIEYDGTKEHREQIFNLLENIPKEAYHIVNKKEKDISVPTVIGQALVAASSPFQPNKIKSPLSWTLGLPTILEGVETLFTKGIKVEVLDASAVLFSLLRKDYTTSNTIVALLGIASWLEQWTEEMSDDLLKKLLKPQVENVWVERDTKEVSIPFSELKADDIVICGTGELIPVDGVILDGEAAVNKSSITGESLPVHVQAGDEVLSGSVLEDGRLRIVAKHVGQETSMARITRFLEHSLRNPSESQKESSDLADKLVPVTFGLGLLLFALTKDIGRAASVLTVDYSCAIKLAAPIAVKSAMYSAGQSGVLLKGGQALDSLSKIDTIVFDKTGTLTKGNLEIVDIIPLKSKKSKFAKLSQEKLLALTASAEEHYGHPLARAVVEEAKKRNLTFPEVSQVDFIVAHGVSAFVDNKQIRVGSRHFLEDDENIDCSEANAFEADLRSLGKSILYIAKEDELIGIISLRDEIRHEAHKTLKELKNSGIKNIVMLTGDHKDTAIAIASELEYIDEVHWELKPEDKANLLYKMQAEGKKLAFAGDGVNDAPALLSADVGICMPKGADLARESAQMVLLEEDLGLLVLARNIAMQAQKTLKNSFYSTISINSLILLFASMGKVNPALSAFLHNAGTVGILAYAAKAAGKK